MTLFRTVFLTSGLVLALFSGAAQAQAAEQGARQSRCPQNGDLADAGDAGPGPRDAEP